MVGYINVSLEIWGCVLCFVVAICLVIGCEYGSPRSRIFLYLLLCNGLLLFSDALAVLFKGHMDSFSWWVVRIGNFMVFALSFILLVLFTRYLTCYLEERTQVSHMPLWGVRTVCLIALLLVFFSQFNHMFYLIDEKNIYHRQSWFWISQVFGITGMCFNAGLLIRYRHVIERNEVAALWSYIFLPVLAMTIQIFIYGIALLNLSTTVSILVIFLFLQVEQARRMKEQELELAESRVAIMISQIQPHFIYNSLLGIKQLCDTEPKRASEALEHFSYYLRGNLYSLSDTKLIPFEKEVEHVKDYLYLEKMRFEERLTVQWEILFNDFYLPALTLQPLVENAVRHGILRKDGGGILTIRCKEEGEYVTIVVADDGIGFNMDVAPDKSRPHVGIENVRKRIQVQCGGSLEIHSKLGVGTEVRLTLPKEGVL